MPALGAKGLVKAYGDRAIVTGADLTLEVGERVGLVGVNGSGKSTLARMLVGLVEADAGEVTLPRGSRLEYLEQEPDLDADATAVDVAVSGLRDWAEAMRAHEAASAALDSGAGDTERHLEAQANAAAAIERAGGWDVQHKAEAILGHLGVRDPSKTVGTMSGGERRRVALARLLVAAPDVAVLDEPTNHLDVATIEWLEDYLAEQFTGALLLITHDRYLLDRVVTRTLELERGVVHSYDGGWDAYLVAKSDREAHEQRVEANRQNFLRRELEWLRRQPKARTTKSKSRVARAEQALADGPAASRGAAVISAAATRTGKTLLETRDLAVDIGGARVVDDLSLTMKQGDRIGIIGPNGAGKTTLLRALLGQLEPAAGSVVRGANTAVAYLDQSRAGLVDDKSIFDNVAEGRAQIEVGDQAMPVRTYLQRFLFSVPEQGRAVGTLSGGERARVALARVLREKTNLIVLDEPTNDLDVTTLAALEAALLDFGGSALVVTHDRWFLDRIASSILAFEGDGRVVHVHGGYDDYRTWQARDRAEAEAREAAEAAKRARKKAGADSAPSNAVSAAPAPDAEPAAKKLTFTERHELEGLLERIDAAEEKVAAIEADIAAPSFVDLGHAEQAALADNLAAARAEADALVERWTELEARSELG